MFQLPQVNLEHPILPNTVLLEDMIVSYRANYSINLAISNTAQTLLIWPSGNRTRTGFGLVFEKHPLI